MIKSQRLPDSSGVRTTGILIAVVFVLYMAREILISGDTSKGLELNMPADEAR